MNRSIHLEPRKRSMRVLSVSIILLMTPVFALGFSSGRASFSVQVGDDVCPYGMFFTCVVPDEVLDLEVVQPSAEAEYECVPSAGNLILAHHHVWKWKAPHDAGLYPVIIAQSSPPDSITVNVFVMVPYNRLKGHYLNGYRIGAYPKIPLKQLPIYKPPRGFLEVTEENEETRLSPHFTLKQFVCKQNGGYPKYIVLKERLLLKLELVLEEMNARGYPCTTFHVMSGYRTPYYNKLIGNVKYSRHVYGGAADIFIDEDPEDGIMDDLNKDGSIDCHDADVLCTIIDDLYREPFYEHFLGGLARYKKNENHGPFVHVDVRGFRVGWGD